MSVRLRRYGEHSLARCRMKRVYPTWWEAERAAVQLMDDIRDGKLRRQKSGGIYAYRCYFCDCWHIGHQPPPKHPFRNSTSALFERLRWLPTKVLGMRGED